MAVKLGKRLKTISAMVPAGYDHIWDCCCDHGLLGETLLNKFPESKIHFLDIVPELIDSLEVKLQQQVTDNWQVHLTDLLEFRLPESTVEESHLMIICGVGGTLMIDMVNTILAHNPNYKIDFILSPVRFNYQLRENLRRQEVRLLNEKLVEERGRFYEVLHLSQQQGEQVSDIGEQLYREQIKLAQSYLEQMVAHYQRKAPNDPDAAHVLNLYSGKLSQLLTCPVN